MIKAAVIGAGYWGPNLIRNIAEHEEMELRWVCDLSPSRLRKTALRYPGVETTRDTKDIYKDGAVDLVVIATPVDTHYPLAKQALKEGRHVLVTKPMASSTAECSELIDLAAKKQRLLMVDHTFVYHPAVQYVKEMIDKNTLGDLLYYQSSRMNLGLYQADVSVIYDLMPHDLSILNEWIPEDPTELSVSSKHVAGLPQPDVAYLQLNYQSNFIASIQASWLSPSKVRETVLTGRKKMVCYNEIDVVQKIKIFDKGVDQLDQGNSEKSYIDRIRYRQGDISAPAIPQTEALKSEMDHLVDCLQKEVTPKTDGYQGLRVVRLLEWADRLARDNRCWVTIPSQEKRSSATKEKPAPKPNEQIRS